MRLDDDVVEPTRLDAVRVSAGSARAVAACDDGPELLALGPRRTDDRGEILEGRWGD